MVVRVSLSCLWLVDFGCQECLDIGDVLVVWWYAWSVECIIDLVRNFVEYCVEASVWRSVVCFPVLVGFSYECLLYIHFP